MATMIPLPDALPSPLPVERSSPRLWGLSVREIHDAWWAARGVQVVRQGVSIRLQRSAELYLLVESGQLVLFDVGLLSERLLWRNARITRLRVVDDHGDQYHEELQFDGQGNVHSVARHYRSASHAAHRVLMTTSRRLASLWMTGSSPRSAWSRIRRAVPWSSVDHRRISGRHFSEDVWEDDRECLNAIVETWLRPDQAIDGIESHGGGVWMMKSDRPYPSALLIGPVWLGHGASDARGGCVIGPAWREDEGPAEPEFTAFVRPIDQVEPAGDMPRRSAGIRPGWANSTSKRLIDIVASLVGIMLLLPLMPILAGLVVLESGQPVFFGHVRQTRGGGVFRCWKFRTMVRNAQAIALQLSSENQADGPQFFIRNDPRVTRIGRIFRKWHLDELPQLWNVLRGHMSLVGPRPSPDGENQFCPAWRDIRLSVRPGITGLWQLKRTREPGTDFQEWIRYDIEYVRTASFLLDVRIIVQTILSMIRRKN